MNGFLFVLTPIESRGKNESGAFAFIEERAFH